TFDNPFGIAIDNAGNIYVTDTGSSRVEKFDPSGNFISTFAVPYPGLEWGLAVDNNGNIYVAAHNNVEKFDSDGTLLARYGPSDSEKDNLVYPSHVTGPGANIVRDSGLVLPYGATAPKLSTGPEIKLISVRMSPNPLKVGDRPSFTLTYQNISDKPFYVSGGCGGTPLGVVILPSDSVVAGFPTHVALCGISFGP